MAWSEWKNVNAGYTIPRWLLSSPSGGINSYHYDRLTLDVSDYTTLTIGDFVKGSGCKFNYVNINGVEYTNIDSIPRTYDVASLDTITILVYVNVNAAATFEIQNITVT